MTVRRYKAFKQRPRLHQRVPEQHACCDGHADHHAALANPKQSFDVIGKTIMCWQATNTRSTSPCGSSNRGMLTSNMPAWLYVTTVLFALLFNTASAAVAEQADLCTLLGNNPLPLATTDICASAGFDQPGGPSSTGCTLLGLVTEQLRTVAAEVPRCAARQSPVANVTLDGTPIPLPLSDQRPLPQTIPPSVTSKEGGSLYWYYKSLHNFGVWSSCTITKTPQTLTRGAVQATNSTQRWLRPTGWQVISTVWLKDATGAPGQGLGNATGEPGAEYSPIAVLMKKGDSMTVLIRGTRSGSEWIADFQYQQVPGNSSILNVPGHIHSGFNGIASYLWGTAIKAALDNVIVRKAGTQDAITSVTYAGHSLGAGLATLLSHVTQSYLNARLAKLNTTVKVDAVLFAPPNVGDPAFVAAFNKLVNARRVLFKYDIVPEVPCTPSMAACPHTPVPTPNPNGSGVWQYGSIGGTININPEAMPQQQQSWDQLKQLYACKLPQYLTAAHMCSYTCYLSTFVDDRNNMCLLHDRKIRGGRGTYCTSAAASFPDKDKYPFA